MLRRSETGRSSTVVDDDVVAKVVSDSLAIGRSGDVE